jgi:hypothetical protein
MTIVRPERFGTSIAAGTENAVCPSPSWPKTS